MTCGIYKITNKLNNKSYIGKSQNIENRFEEHINHTSRFPSKFLWEDLNINTKDNFLFEIIEECDKEDLSHKERYYIETLNTMLPNGYNGTNGGETLPGFRFIKQSEKQRGITRSNKIKLGLYENKYMYHKNMILINNKIYNKYVKKEELQQYLDDGWTRGIREEDKLYGERNGMYGKHAPWLHSRNTFGKNNSFYGKHHTEKTKSIISKKNSKEGNGRYGKLWITKNQKNKSIFPEELEDYIKEGWKKKGGM